MVIKCAHIIAMILSSDQHYTKENNPDAKPAQVCD